MSNIVLHNNACIVCKPVIFCVEFPHHHVNFPKVGKFWLKKKRKRPFLFFVFLTCIFFSLQSCNTRLETLIGTLGPFYCVPCDSVHSSIKCPCWLEPRKDACTESPESAPPLQNHFRQADVAQQALEQRGGGATAAARQPNPRLQHDLGLFFTP